MKRRYVYPIVVLTAGILLLVSERYFGPRIGNDRGEKVVHNPAYHGEDLSISASVEETGTLEVSFSLGGSGTSGQLDGTLYLTLIHEGGTEADTEEIPVAVPVVLVEDLQPGKYRLVGRIGIPGTDYYFLARPQELVIEPWKTTRHTIDVPPAD